MTCKAEPKDWHQADVIAAVRKRGTTLAKVATAAGYKNPRTIYRVFDMRYPKAARLIADFLDTTPDQIWPSRYQPGEFD